MNFSIIQTNLSSKATKIVVIKHSVVVYEEEQAIDDAGKEEEFVLDFYTEIYFSSLVWRLAREAPELFQEEMEQR